MNSRVTDRAMRRAATLSPVAAFIGVAAIGYLILGAADPAHATFLAQANGSAQGDCKRDRESYIDGGSLSFEASGSVQKTGLVIDCPNYPTVAGWEATAQSNASLLLGKLEAFASATGPLPNEDVSPFGPATSSTFASASAQVLETLQIIFPAAPGADSITVPVTLSVAGTVENTGSLNTSGFEIFTRLGSEFRRLCNGVFRDLPGSFPTCSNTASSGAVVIELTQFFTVPVIDPFLAFRAELTLAVINSATLNFLGSATLSVGLPDGFSFTSESGVFLTGLNGNGAPTNGDPTAVPEPSTLAIFAIGLAGLGFFGWRRRAA